MKTKTVKTFQPYRCPKCGKRQTTKDASDKHMRSHAPKDASGVWFKSGVMA